MKSPGRKGFFGTIKHLDILHYVVFLGADKPATVYFKHDSDGYEENCLLVLKSVERREYPNPHIIRGILEHDVNRPGEDAGDMPVKTDVVLELWSYPETLVYIASDYVPANWMQLGDLPTGSIFMKDIKQWIKLDNKSFHQVEKKANNWTISGTAKQFDSTNQYEPVIVIDLP